MQKMRRRAHEAPEGMEDENWPEKRKIGFMVPLWKKKERKEDQNTWRGVTLLSVGSKLLARVVIARLQRWSEAWLHEA